MLLTRQILGIAVLLSVFLSAALLAGPVPTKGAKVGEWTMDYDAALQLAAEKNLPVFLNFTGSDWCGWCKKMAGDVFSKPDWQDYARKNLVLVTLDFPRDPSIVPANYASRNRKLQELYGVEGYPTYLLLDSDGKTLLGKLGASRGKTPAIFIEEVKDVLRFSKSHSEAFAKTLSAADAKIFRGALQDYRSGMAALEEWLQTDPERTPDNEARFQAFIDSIKKARAIIDAF